MAFPPFKVPPRPPQGWRRAGVQRLQGTLKARSLTYYAGSSLVCQALRFSGMVFATRLLRPDDFGAFAQALIIMGLPCILRDLGLSNALIAYRGNDRRYARFHFQALLISSVICAVLVAGLMQFWKGLAPGVSATTGCLAVIILIEGLSTTGIVMAQKSFRFKALAGVEICATLSWLAVLILSLR